MTQNRQFANPTRSEKTHLLGSVRLDHGPVAQLGKFLLDAEADTSARGVQLSIEPLSSLAETNKHNRSSWLPLVGVFDPQNGGTTAENSFALIGRNAEGEVVATNAARRYDWAHTNFADECSSLRLFYSDVERMRCPGETCMVTAPSARSIAGCVVYSGAAWYRPDYRGRGLSALLPRIAKAIAFGRWNPDFIVSLMTESVHKRGFLKMVTYPHIEWAVEWRNSPLGSGRLAIVWMEADEVPSHIGEYGGPPGFAHDIFKRTA